METSGMVRISLLPGGEAGWCYYSEPVVLMPEEGDLWIDLALVTSDGQVVFGDMGPFTDCEYTEEPVQAEIGALLGPPWNNDLAGLLAGQPVGRTGSFRRGEVQ